MDGQVGRRSAVPATLARLARAAGVSPLAVALLVLAAGGVAWALVRPAVPAPDTTASSLPATAAPGGAVGSIPILGDPIRDLTAWYADRVSDANRAALANLRGRLLTPVDPLADGPVMRLYGTMVAITIPILTLGGLALGFLIMTGQASGDRAYEVRSVTPRFVSGAVVALLGVFLVSALAQFTGALDAAMVGVSLLAGAVGGPDAWPAGGGVFEVLAKGGFDPSVAQGPGNWNDGAWLSVGLLAGMLSTLLAMGAWALAGVELLLVLVGPLCLAAYALTATERVTRLWLRALAATYLVRFAWTIAFALFSLMALPHVGASGAPPTLGDTNLLLGLATGALAMMLFTPLVLVPLALGTVGAVAQRTVEAGRLVIERYAA